MQKCFQFHLLPLLFHHQNSFPHSFINNTSSSTCFPSSFYPHVCKHPPPHPLRFGCLSSNPPFEFSLIVLFLLISCVIATTDYPTLALRDTLSSLCEVNQEGTFGSCCRAYDISSVSIEKSEERDCFIYDLISTSDGIEYLFVYLRLFQICISQHSHFSSYHFLTKD